MVRAVWAAVVIVLGSAMAALSVSSTGSAAAVSQVMFSTDSDRSLPAVLEAAVVTGNVYVFVDGPTTIRRVRFWVDDPQRAGTPAKDERNAPWDLAGTATNGMALPYDTSKLASGQHVVTALVELTDATAHTIHAHFMVGTAGALQASPASLELSAGSDSGPVERPLLIESGSDVASVTLSSDRSWLTVTPTGGATPLDASVIADPAALAVGSHAGTILVTADGFVTTRVSVILTVSGGSAVEEILLSKSNTRSPASGLAGATVQGDIFVFVEDEIGLDTVRFWVDDAAATGSPYRTESSAPYDLAGGTSSLASPFRTTSVPDGPHTVTARLEYVDGSQRSTSAEFIVANNGPSLRFDPPRDMLEVPDSRPTAELAPVLSTTSSSPSVQLATDATWLRLPACCTSLPATVPITVDPTSLPDGRHTGTVTATASGFGSATYSVQLTVAGEAPTQVHLAYLGDPRTTITVVWRTNGPVTSDVHFRPAGETEWRTVTGDVRTFSGAGVLHESTLTGLTPGTTYEYRLLGDGSATSPVHSFSTAPAGDGQFDAVYVADTGIVGRADGLTTGTADVIRAIADLRPVLVLPGGDYAYFNTDKRFATQDAAIDAWFEQVEPFAVGAAMMPTYGNHEVLLKEEYGPWAARFPTPDGHDGRRNYSFDVGPVHFVSLFAVYNQQGLTSGQLRWLRQDLAAARLAGQRWLVPYMHVSTFAAGTNHPSNVKLRGQLGPIFENNDVDLVLMSHDQAYERTWPLVGVPTAIKPTSHRIDCVDKTDGVTWVTISPGGKLSNQNGGFSPYASEPPPAWTAVRSNTAHHVGRLRYSSQDGLRLEVFALAGSGGAPFLRDTVRFAPGVCG